MAKQIKKYGKKALVFALIILLVGMYVTIPVGEAVDLTKERDTLSDSRPSVISSHTVIFKATTAVPLSGHVIIDLPATFTTPAMDFSDVAIYWDSSDPPTTACTMAASCSATDCCVTVTEAEDKIDITLKSGAGIVLDDYVKVVIGDGAAAGWEDITNPTAGSYDVDIITQNASAVEIDTGKAMVYVIAGVTVSATVSESLTFARVGLVGGSCTGDTGTIDATIDTSGDADTVPFGTLGTNFTVACQQLTVTTNAANGYVVTEQEDDQLKFDSTELADTICDANACPIASSNAAAWTDTSTVSGFGHGCEKSSGNDVVCVAAYDVWSSNKYYRQFASIADADSAQTLMSYTSGAQTVSDVAIIHYKIKASSFQAAGTYQNAIVYIATPTY